jgi:hypothetical protein
MSKKLEVENSMELSIFLAVCLGTLLTNGGIVLAGVIYINWTFAKTIAVEREMYAEITSKNESFIKQLTEIQAYGERPENPTPPKFPQFAAIKIKKPTTGDRGNA